MSTDKLKKKCFVGQRITELKQKTKNTILGHCLQNPKLAQHQNYDNFYQWQLIKYTKQINWQVYL